MVKVYLPALGENITKATVSYWYFGDGAAVIEGNDLVEIVTDKATFNVPSPCSGVLVEIMAHEGDVCEVGDVLAVIEKEGGDDAESEEE
ncbi:MAG: hypothetical protein AUJ74_03045 [Candidatus Omnitrophica bacterium CG1_02_44_16]|nr:MAG: hypothetical protein AUJ74_03045 [Candidatus Omnitrophica bacterium CG1_02_44_16]PIY82789.1 MAG: hypothetical protein COY78_04655 [Candidatus Omnitrophica bacterium CG_4_10_14_0_8_um_filter_44_12]PIZ84036.1 MAG: hypothetical protein COX96_05805 [Candidatus Omnitrophica bacterium CG_4_10_14_0_2_um_filter_44_9]